jgi:hypothetical protein
MNKIYYNLELLNQYCKNNLVKLNINYDNLDINRNTKINGVCKNQDCLNTFEKTFVYMVKYGAFCKICSKKNQQIKMKQTNLKKYGVENPFSSNEIKDKIKKTNLEKYGVENPNYSKEILEKKINNCLIKYGVKHTCQLESIIQQRKQSCMDKYGTYYPIQSELGKNQIKKSCLEKYGVENPQQNPEIAEKASNNSYRKKIYILPSSKEIICQGYEPLALDKLVKEDNILEEDIVTGCKNVPTIWYNDENNKKHRHYVDIFIPSQNRCIEVKSTWTAEKKKDNIFLKQEAAKQLGYNYEIWVYNSKKKLVEVKS